ncbi:hypothetical protein HAX54_015389, partial [Datura stramonium]|nr:hypothetical protein [Datura stramonium]
VSIVLGTEGKYPIVKKNDDDFDGDEENEYEGDKDDEGFTKAAKEIMASCAKNVLVEGSKVNTNEIIYDEGSKREKKIEVERNHDSEFHNKKNDDYYVADEDDINMALQQTVD